MMRRTLVLCTVLLAMSACRGATNPARIAGQYDLAGADGQLGLPCCSITDSSGTVVSIGGGLLQIGWNTPAGTYRWDIIRVYDYPDGTSNDVQSEFSSGTYRWDGTTLTLEDTTGNLGRMTGSLGAPGIVVQAPDHRYGFLKLHQLPD
jgi:hypothetical protein